MTDSNANQNSTPVDDKTPSADGVTGGHVHRSGGGLSGGAGDAGRPAGGLGMGVMGWMVGVAALVMGMLALRGGFVWGDDALIVSNTHLLNGYGLQLLWTSIFPSPAAYPLDMYTPVSYSLLSLQWRLFGDEALGYHAVSMVLHVLGSLLALRLMLRLGIRGAGIAGMLFAAHPLQFGSVAWLSAQPMMFGVLLGMGSLYVLLRWMDLTRGETDALPSQAGRLLVLGVALGVVAGLAHPLGGLAPLVAVGILWWKRGGFETKHVSPLVPAMVVGVGLLALFFVMQKNALGAANRAELNYGINALAEVTARAQVAGYVLGSGVLKTLVPWPMVFDAGRPGLGGLTLGYAGAVLAVVVAVVTQREKLGRGAVLCVVLYGLLLLPWLGLMNIDRMRYSFFVDVYMYAALLPLGAMIGSLVSRLTGGKLDVGIALGVAVVGVGVSAARAGDYRDTASLLERTLAKNDRSLLAHTERAWALWREQDAGFVEHLNKALEISPRHLEARRLAAMLPKAEGSRGRLRDSIDQLAQLSSEHPGDAETLYMLGEQLETGGRVAREAGQDESSKIAFAQSFESFQQAARADRRHVRARLKVAELLVEAGLFTPNAESQLAKFREAVAALDDAVALAPNRIETRLMYGKLLYEMAETGKAEELPEFFRRASEQFVAVTDLDASHAEPLLYAGLMNARLGNTEAAEAGFNSALVRRPDWIPPMLGIAEIRLKQERYAEAREWAEKARAIDAGNAAVLKLMEKLDALPPTGATPVPTGATHVPTGATPAPTGAMPAPTDAGNASGAGAP